MSHFLTDEQRAFRDAAATFVRKEIEPRADEIDRDERTPPELTRKMAENGFFGLFISEDYGGAGADLTTACLVVEEIAKASPAYAGLVSVQMILCPEAVLALGSDEQKRRLLPRSATGERLLAYSQSEPAGSGNLDYHLTKLTREGDAWRLNGAKLFCSQGEALTYLVMCRTQRDGKTGYGCVIVDREDAGFEVAPYEHKLGWRGTNTGSIGFTDVAIADDDILGDLLTANADLLASANQASFMGHSASSLGCAVGMFEKTLAQAKEKSLHGVPLYQLGPWRDRLGMAYNKIEAMRALLYTSTRLYDEGTRNHHMGSVCKAWICETAFEVCNTLLQVWGGSGMMDATGINRYFRDARTNMVAEGTTEVHTMLVTHAALGLT